MTRSKYRPDQQPDPEEVGEMLTRLEQLRDELRTTMDTLTEVHVIANSPAEHTLLRKQLTLQIETITAEMTRIRAWLMREGVIRGGGI